MGMAILKRKERQTKQTILPIAPARMEL